MTQRTILVNASFGPSLLNFRGPLLRELVRAGHRVHVSAPRFEPDHLGELRALGACCHEVPLQRTGTDLLADLRYKRALQGIIRSACINLVMGYTIKPCIWGSLAAAAEGTESVSLVTGLGYVFTGTGGIRRQVIKLGSRWLWRRATAANRVVIFQNPDDRAEFISAGLLADPGKARLVNGSGVDMMHYHRAPLPAQADFLMIARLLGNKGTREFGRAASHLLREGVAARFSLAGYLDEGPDGIDPAELAQWRAAGMQYLGSLADVRPALASCSVFVLPSYREGTPRTVLEAMATGRAVITSDAPGCRETVEDGKSGLLVAPRDTEALTAAMRRLISSPDEREAMAEAGWQRCKHRYEVDSVNTTMLQHLGLLPAD